MSKYKGPYKKPVVTAIELDPEQAIIVVCSIAASGWMNGTGVCFAGGVIPATCNTAVRGMRTDTRAKAGGNAVNAPS